MKRVRQDTKLLALVEMFNQDRDGTIDAVYRTFRSGYYSYARSMCSDDTLIVDSFQEAVIGLYENLAGGKVKEVNNTVKTYLFTIGRFKLLNAIKKEQHQQNLGTILNHDSEWANTADVVYDKMLLAKGMNELGEKCRQILIKFYFHRYSIESIMHDLDYKNENTVKAHKSRCLTQLRTFLKKIDNI